MPSFSDSYTEQVIQINRIVICPWLPLNQTQTNTSVHTETCTFLGYSFIKFPRMGYSFAPFWYLCQKLSLSPLYFNKTLLHKSSERSSLISGPWLNASPPEAKNPASQLARYPQYKMGLIIYVSLLLLTPEILSLPFDPQNAFLSWAHSYAAFHNRSNC